MIPPRELAEQEPRIYDALMYLHLSAECYGAPPVGEFRRGRVVHLDDPVVLLRDFEWRRQ